MRWRSPKGLALFALAGMLVFSAIYFIKYSSTELHCHQQGDCPNIVLVILDDMPWSHFGFMSAGISVTPHLDEMAKQGFVFRNVYNTSSRCRASLATYLTGQLPHQNLIYSNQGVLKLHDEKSLLPVLSEAGYATFAGGKMWEGNPEQLKLTDYDLDTFNFVRKTQDKLNDFLDRYAGNKPFFVWWAPLLPHKNHNPSFPYFQRINPQDIVIPDSVPLTERNSYREAEHAFLATISWVDDEVGKLIQSLHDHGGMENTWIVVLSDNGWSNVYPAKGATYDIGVRTPMVVNGPGVRQGQTNQLISTQNLYGSLLSLAGLKADVNREATEDVFVIARQKAKSTVSPVHNSVFWASYPSYTGKSEPHPRAGRDVYALSMREDHWQYTFYVKSFEATGNDEEKAPSRIQTGMKPDFNYHEGDEELFDLSEDPFSERNLSSDNDKQDLLPEFRKKVFDWWKTTGGKEIDGIQNCRSSNNGMCTKYYEIQI
jgi:arylsulfatase A-like enzyme